jgi:hypothetical protein
MPKLGYFGSCLRVFDYNRGLAAVIIPHLLCDKVDSL